ncbi:MAG: hypothetical protein RLZZ387_3077 [Chloroflexota bacterium]|jgi:hypothetical protein
MTAFETAPHTADYERRLVQAAIQPREIGAWLGALFADVGASPGDPCRVLDMKYEPGQYCRILYQLGGRMLIGSFRWGEDEGEVPETARLVAPLGMQAYLFQHDPDLPGLATALDPERLARMLEDEVPEVGGRVLRVRTTPLRYRPGRRCTLRVDYWARDGGARPRAGTLFGKVYHDLEKAESVYRDMRLLAESEPARAGRVVLVRPVTLLREPRLMLQAPVAGTSLELLLEGMRDPVTAGDRRGWDGVVASAEALAAVHGSGVAAGRERSIDAELRRFARRAAQAAAVDAQVGGRLVELAAALPAWRGRLPEWGERLTLVHGDCKHSQCLLTDGAVAVLDFDHCGMADPANDIGLYLATLRQLGIHQRLLAHGSPASEARARWLRELEGAFLGAYCAASGYGEGFRLRATWYEAVALMRKALRAFARSPRSPMPGAEVEEAWRCLAELPAA